MSRFLPRSLIGQMALLIGIALLIAQIANFALILNERQKFSLAQNQGPAIARFAGVASDLGQAYPEFRTAVIQDASRRGAQFRLSRTSNVPATAMRADRAEERLRQALATAGVEASEVRAAQSSIRRVNRNGRAADLQLLLLSARLGDSWLNARVVTPRPDPWLSYRLAGATLLLYLIVLGATLFIATRLARPLRDLPAAAEKYGGREAPPSVEPREDILVLARSGRAREEGRATDLAALADALVEEYRELGQPVTFLGGARAVARLQPNLMRRALRNLIDNAIKYGGSAEVSVRSEDDSLLVEVADHGPGLGEDQIGRVLEPFYRVEGSRNRETGGAGLGLAIAKAVAESHGGALRLRNGAAGGLVATIALPAQ